MSNSNRKQVAEENGFSFSVIHQDPYTYAVVEKNGMLAFGFTKRHARLDPEDDPELASNVAIGRALDNYWNHERYPMENFNGSFARQGFVYEAHKHTSEHKYDVGQQFRGLFSKELYTVVELLDDGTYRTKPYDDIVSEAWVSKCLSTDDDLKVAKYMVGDKLIHGNYIYTVSNIYRGEDGTVLYELTDDLVSIKRTEDYINESMTRLIS